MSLLVIISLIIFLIIAMLSGLRLAFAMAFIGMVTIYLVAGMKGLTLVGYGIWNGTASFTLVAIPLFLLMGNLIMASGIAEKAYEDLTAWVHFLPGRLLISNIGASAVFAAVSGSSLATTVTIGNVAIPIQRAQGYNPRYICGSISAGGLLGILIPPSINMILYGAVTETSVGKLFIGGIIPGIILTTMFIVFIILYSTLRTPMAPPTRQAYSWRDRVRGLRSLVPVVTLIIIVMGSIYTGIATPTEAAAMGVFGAAIINIAYSKVTWAGIRDSLIKTTVTTSWCLFLFVGATILGIGFSRARIPQQIAHLMSELGLTPLTTVIFLALMYIGLGCLLDPISMLLVTMPVVHPLLISMNIDTLWFGVFYVLLSETGLVTPPVGLNLFAVAGITGTPIKDVIAGVFPYIIILMIMMTLLIAFPPLATWLPSLMF